MFKKTELTTMPTTPSPRRARFLQALAAIVTFMLVAWILLTTFVILAPPPSPAEAEGFERWQRMHFQGASQ